MTSSTPPSTTVQHPYTPREWQREVHATRARFCIAEVHRRAGKTELGLAELARALLGPENAGKRGLYCAPLKTQGKAVVWARSKAFFDAAIVEVRESEGRLIFSNQSSLTVAGAGDEGQHFRGMSFHAVVLDEFAYFEPQTWYAAIRPAVSDTKGEVLFISTPSSSTDALHQLKKETLNLPEWSHHLFTVNDTKVIPPEELQSLQSSMPPFSFEMEFMCDAEAPTPASVFGHALSAMRDRNRIRPSFPIDPALPLQAALDLGIADATSAWVFQALPGEVRLLAFREWNGTSLREIAGHLTRQGVTRILGPHDLRVRELSSGRTRLELLQDLGFDVEAVSNIPLEEGLSVTSRLIEERLYADQRYTALGLAHLRSYRRNPENRKPIHDDSSHAADSLRYLAVGLRHSSRSPSYNVRSSGGIVRKVTPHGR